MYLPDVESIPSLPTADRAHILNVLFEPSTALHTLSIDLLHTQTFQSYDDLIVAVEKQMLALAGSKSSSDTQWLDSILAAHPRLGSLRVDSEQSRAEQGRLNTQEEDSWKVWRDANEQYEAAFPGLRFVVFVNGRTRTEVIRDLETRISRGDIEAERLDTIKAMRDIAMDRARKLKG